MYEIIGILASICVLISLTFKCVSLKRNIVMRIINSIGSILFFIYGMFISAWSIVICNGLITIFNTYHLIILFKELKKNNNN